MQLKLQGLAGAWRGTTKTFFDPNTPAEEAATEVDVEVILGGRHVRLTYASVVMGSPHVGEMTFSHDGRFSVTWLDSFHTGDAVMALAGEKGGDFTALGSYAAGPERWGWRITLSLPAPDGGAELFIDEKNISPAGEVYPAVEMRLRRVR